MSYNNFIKKLYQRAIKVFLRGRGTRRSEPDTLTLVKKTREKFQNWVGNTRDTILRRYSLETAKFNQTVPALGTEK